MPNQNTNPKMHTPNLVNNNIDRSQERYRLDWVGKREAIVNANSPINKYSSCH